MPIIYRKQCVGPRPLTPRVLTGRSTGRSKVVIVALCLSVIGCAPKDHETRSTTVQEADRSGQLGNQSPSVPLTARLLSGPSIVIDSTAIQARLEQASGHLIVHLSSQMARVMYDSLPRFTPLPQSTYGTPRPNESDSAYSVVVGDFDGDSLQDVAMLGTSRNSPVLFMLLAKADSAGRTIFLIEPASPPDSRAYRLAFVGPQRLQSPDNKDYFVDLRTDAIHLQSESVSAVCYLDHGTLRWFGLAGD